MAEHISAKSFSLASCQATLFTPDKELSTRRLLADLAPEWTSRFDAEPIALPQAEGMPSEVPRLRLESQTKAWVCQIAPIRIDIFWRRSAPDTPQISIESFFSQVSPLLIEYKRVSGSRIGRLAAVINRYSEHSSPGIFLSRHFCRDRWIQSPLNRPENFELHAHKRYLLETGLTVNSWIHHKTGQVSSAGAEARPIILVEQDLNTLAEEEHDFGNDAIRDFFSLVTNEFDKILGLYYPDPNGA